MLAMAGRMERTASRVKHVRAERCVQAQQPLMLRGTVRAEQLQDLPRQVHQLTLYLKRPFFAALTWI